MSGRVVQFVVRFGYRFSSDFAGRHGTQKSPQTVQVQGLFGLYRMSWSFQVAERVGFEPTYQLITGNSISSRARYGRFATSPSSERL